MTHFADLAKCKYFPPLGVTPIAVGWLDAEHDYAKGAVTPAFFDALMTIANDPWAPFVSCGVHRCELCRFSGGPGSVHYGDKSVTVGVANLFVPGDGVLYAAPSTILHYIDAHGYAPPDSFQRAVTSCPPMRSMDYLKRLRALGVTLKPQPR